MDFLKFFFVDMQLIGFRLLREAFDNFRDGELSYAIKEIIIGIFLLLFTLMMDAFIIIIIYISIHLISLKI